MPKEIERRLAQLEQRIPAEPRHVLLAAHGELSPDQHDRASRAAALGVPVMIIALVPPSLRGDANA